MKFVLKINGSESPDAAYVGWTPVKCTLGLEDVTAESPVIAKITIGDIGQEGKLSLYESNAPDSNPVAMITHDIQPQKEFVFYIAGKFNHASVGKKDTFLLIENPLENIPSVKREIMIRVRKNANSLTQQEIDDFLRGFLGLSAQKTRKEYSEDNYTKIPESLLDEIIMMHTLDAAGEIHRRTSFHPWHRVFQMHLEREIQKNYPHVTIPYWKFDDPAEFVFTEKFIGKTKPTKSSKATDPDEDKQDLHYGEQVSPEFDATNPLYTYAKHVLWGGALKRAYRFKNPATEKPEKILSERQIICGGDKIVRDRFFYWSTYEERNSHNNAHGTFTGHVVDIGKDPMDPLFFLMHGNVDRLWALWQHEYERFDASDENTYPFQYSYNGPRGEAWKKGRKLNEDGYYTVGNPDIGNFADDTLWPWDLDHELSRPIREWKSMRVGYGEGKVPQINIQFPTSITSGYPDGSLTVKSTIDYQGRNDNQPPHGVDYDMIPYFEHDKQSFCALSPKSIPNNTAAFFDKSLSLSERLSVAENAFPSTQEDQTRALQTIADKKENPEIRIKSISLADETKSEFLDTALNVIANESESPDLRSELIHHVFASNRSNRHYPSRKPTFFDILRGLLKNNNSKLRFQAIDILASQQDEVLQEFLVEELEKKESKFISKPDAIFFLRENPKPQHAALFRKVFEGSTDPELRKAAIEGLGNDPDAAELLEKVVMNNGENFKVREASALALHHLDHETMNALAEKIVAEPEGSDGIMLFKSSSANPDEAEFKAGLLNMLTFTGDVNRLKKNEGLKSALKEVVDSSTANKANFRDSFEMLTATPSTEPITTIVEQIAAKLLNRLEGNANE